jgi:uncharacterized protein
VLHAPDHPSTVSQAISRSVAVIGASDDPDRPSHQAVLRFAAAGWRVVPIHPRLTAVAGHSCAPDLEHAPGPIDLVALYVRPAIALGLLPQITASGARVLWLNPGADSTAADGPALVAAAQAAGLQVVEACALVVLGWGDPWAVAMAAARRPASPEQA